MNIPSINKTSHLPLSVSKAIENFALKLLSIHESNLTGILVYGSAAGVNFNPAKSDINIAVIVKFLDVEVLTKSLDVVAVARKSNISAPLFLTKEYIQSSLDVFPIEFSEIKNHHIVIFGEDLLASLTIDLKHIRLFCEAQIKGKILRIRQSYLESGHDVVKLRSVLHDSLNGLMPIFRQMLTHKNITPAAHKRELLRQFCSSFALNVDHILPIYDDRNGIAVIPVAYVTKHLQDYLDLLCKLADHIDSL